MGMKEKLLLLEWCCGLTTATKAKGGHSNERHKESSAYEVELQISYCICTEIPKEGIFWGEEKGNRENTEAAM